MTKENCNSKYFADGGFRAWRDRNCAILLSSPQFAPGLQACDGVAYPIQIQIEMVCENRSCDLSAESSFGPGAAITDGVIKVGGICRIAADIIRGQAQCTAFYQKVVLATTETAATVNSMNYRVRRAPHPRAASVKLCRSKSKGMSALHFLGRTDTKEEALSQQQEQALMQVLLKGRDPRLYQQLYGLKNVRDVYDPPTRGASGKFLVLPFFDR